MLEIAGAAVGSRWGLSSMASQPTRVISITSGKGGVGKTHTTVNLALALAARGKRVLVLDADLGLANVNILLGFKPASTLQQVVSGTAKLKDVIVSHQGVDIIPASSGIPELTNLSEGERALLVQAVDDLDGEYDYLLIDTAAGIGDNVLYFNVAAEEILVVIDDEPTTITDAYAVMKVLSSKFGRKNFNVVVNRAAIGSDGRTVFAQLANVTDKFLKVGLRFMGAIPEDRSVVEAVVQQKPFFNLYPSSRASLAIAKLAERIDESRAPRRPQGGLQFFFKSLLTGDRLEQ